MSMGMILNLPDRLTERIQIEAPVTTSDDQGGRTISWQLQNECFAEVLIDGQFRPASNQHINAARIRYRITIYPNASITQAMRVVWKNKNLSIHHSEMYATHFVLVCEEEVVV